MSNALLDATVTASIHASHQSGATARTTLEAATSVQAALTTSTTATATRGLTLGINATASLAGAVTDATAAAVLSSTSSFLASLRVSIRGGTSVTNALANGGGVVLPDFDVSVAAAALLNAEGEISLHPSLTMRANLPVLQGLANLALTADENGATWGLGVALPFASDMALAGSVTGDLAGARDAWLTLAWAHRRRVTQ